MRFVADESCDHRVVTALRDAGHNVLAVAETSRGAPDRDVMLLARRERRVLITEDRDFGQLVFAGGQPEHRGRALPALSGVGKTRAPQGGPRTGVSIGGRSRPKLRGVVAATGARKKSVNSPLHPGATARRFPFSPPRSGMDTV
jgi:hypothetical protein